MSNQISVASGQRETVNMEPRAVSEKAPALDRFASFAVSRIDSYGAVLTLVSLLALGPMLQPGYFWGAHDARHSVYFLFEFDRVFTDGVWYPRWFPDMTYGYGYPLFNIYGPLAFYAGEFFHWLGADLVTAVKIVFGLAWVLSGMAMYGFVKRVLTNRPAAFVAGLTYVFMPYHIVDVYVRAALAESVALVFLPLTLWAFYEAVSAPRIRSILFVAFAYAGMVFAHNGVALLFSIVLGAWILFLLARKTPGSRFSRGWFVQFVRAGLPSLYGLILGVGLAGIFLIPLVSEYKYVNVAEWTQNYYNYQEHFVEFYQLFFSKWGFGISQLGPIDGLSFQLGVVPLILTLFVLFAILREKSIFRPIILFFLALTVIVVLLMFDFSLAIWQAFGLAGIAQFPWRLLTLTTVSFSVIVGAVLLNDEALEGTPDSHDMRGLPLSTIALSALIVLGSFPYLTAQNVLEAKEGPVGFGGLMNFEHSANEMTGTTVYTVQQPAWSSFADNIIGGKKIKSKIDYSAKPASLYIGPTRDGFGTQFERIGYNTQVDNTPIIFNIQYYPGWRAYLMKTRSDEIIRELPIQIDSPYGRIKVAVPQGEYFLLLRFEDTPPRIIGEFVSGISLLICLGMFAWDLVRRRFVPKPEVTAPTS